MSQFLTVRIIYRLPSNSVSAVKNFSVYSVHVVRLVNYCNSLLDSLGLAVNNVQTSGSFYKLGNVTSASRCAEHREKTTSCLGVTCNKWKEGIISRSTPLVSAAVTPLRGFLKLPAGVYIRTYCRRLKGSEGSWMTRERLDRNVTVLLFKMKGIPNWLSCLRKSSALRSVNMSILKMFVIFLLCSE